MDFCPSLNSTVHILGNSLSKWYSSLNNLQLCGGDTYLRPNAGGALQPYAWTFLQVVIHAPACVLRFGKYDKVQTLSLCIAGFDIAVTTLSYASTRLAANQVLTWQPTVLTLDAGAMLQVYVLILKEIKWDGFSSQIRQWLFMLFRRASETHGTGDEQGENIQMATGNARASIDEATGERSSLHSVNSADPAHPDPEQLDSRSRLCRRRDGTQNLKKKTIMAAFALVFLAWILSLQIIGLGYAAHGLTIRNLTATWCSPALQPGAVVAIDGNCNLRTVVESASSGIGCVELPATQQKAWLTNTTAILCLTIFFFQITDACVLYHSHLNNKSRTCGLMIDRTRPWLTTIAGLIIYIVLASSGIDYANHLPDGITERILVLRIEKSIDVFIVCESRLVTPGLRGAWIGYGDGLFNNWKGAYYGLSTTSVATVARLRAYLT